MTTLILPTSSSLCMLLVIVGSVVALASHSSRITMMLLPTTQAFTMTTTMTRSMRRIVTESRTKRNVFSTTSTVQRPYGSAGYVGGVATSTFIRRGLTATTTPNEMTEASTTTTTTTTETNDIRLPRTNLSLDLRTITNHLPIVLSHLRSRKAGSETIDAVQTIANNAAERVTLIIQRDKALQERKECSAKVGQLMRIASRTEEQEKELQSIKENSIQAGNVANTTEIRLNEIQGTIDTLIASVPNLLDDIVPDGKDDKDNLVVSTWGDIRTRPTVVQAELESLVSESEKFTIDFQPQWHDDVAVGLGGYRTEAAVQMSGARFVALAGGVARLERALSSFFLDHHTSVNGYTEVTVPYVVSRSALEGTSQLPKFADDLFAISPKSHTCNGEDAFLIPTAEVPVTNLHRNSVLDESDLPISYVALTPCFRAEAGSYGRDTKGLIRTHQFNKVELVKITTPSTSDEQHELLTQHAESCLQLLELPYRKVRLCSGDIGFAAQHCYDLEVWLPGANEYREISSCSNTGDFQAKRMSLRYRPKPTTSTTTTTTNDEDTTKDNKQKKKKTSNTTTPKLDFCHTLNGSGLAVGRTLVAVLENYQLPDGSVVIPKVLRPYMGGKTKLIPPSVTTTTTISSSSTSS